MELERIKAIVKAYEDGTDEAAAWLLKKYKTANTILSRPYVMVFAGIPFEEIEKTRWRNSQLEEDRIEALVFEAYKQATISGGTCVPVEEVIRTAWNIEKRCKKVESHTPTLFLGYGILKKFRYEDGFVCSKRLYRLEGSIAKMLKEIMTHDGIKVSDDEITCIEKRLGIEYDDTQKKAFSLLEAGCSVLTGGPGTGKTTLLKGLIEALKGKKNVIAMAPTGKAAERVREVTGLPAQTIHKTLMIRPYTEGGYQLTSELPDNSFVIVDESSMIDTDLAAAILSAVKESGSNILFVGDVDQLPSVGPGNFLLDIMSWDRMPLCKLEHVHRQENGTVIAENAARVKEGNWKLIIDNKSYFQQDYVFQEEMTGHALALLKKYYKKDNPDYCKIYTPVKDSKKKISTIHINNSAHRMFHNGEPEILINGQMFSVGDPIIITKNSYELEVFNGDTGIVIEILEKSMKVKIDGRDIVLSGSILSHVDLAYATTIHKAQGTSTDIAIIIVPDKPKCLITRRLFYVALTRAKKCAYTLYEQFAIIDSIGNVNERKRYTSLQRRLGKCSRTI